MESAWALPVKYPELAPTEQAKALRRAILSYLQAHGSAAKSVLVKELRVPRPDTLQKALDYLATTQQIYFEATSGSRDRIYCSNGRLAHPEAERIVDCGKIQYSIRSYNDRWAGVAITITQYAVQPSGEKKPVGGIRIDWRDIGALVEALGKGQVGLEAVVAANLSGRQGLTDSDHRMR
jgi:hypothetical protein